MLISAVYPMFQWSGHYDVQPTIYTTAHTTHFSRPGWNYLAVGDGSGQLPHGGSYVTLVEPTATHNRTTTTTTTTTTTGDGGGSGGRSATAWSNFSVVVETLVGDCLRCTGFSASPQNFTFQPGPALVLPPTDAHTTTTTTTTTTTAAAAAVAARTMAAMPASPTLYAYRTNATANLVALGAVQPAADGSYTLELGVDEIVTLTTLAPASPAPVKPAAAAASAAFPMPFQTNFDEMPLSFSDSTTASAAPAAAAAAAAAAASSNNVSINGTVTPRYFSDQAGVFAVEWPGDGSGEAVLVQQVTQKPIEWSPEDAPVTLVGDANATDYEVQVTFQIVEEDVRDYESTGSWGPFIYAGVRIGAWDPNVGRRPEGYLFVLNPVDRSYYLWAGQTALASGTLNSTRTKAFAAFEPYGKHVLFLRADGKNITASVDYEEVTSAIDTTYGKGLACLGTGWHRAQFDNFRIAPLAGPNGEDAAMATAAGRRRSGTRSR